MCKCNLAFLGAISIKAYMSITGEIPQSLIDKWQHIINLMARAIDVPSGLIMRIMGEDIEVFIASQTEGNPYHPHDHERLKDSGLYCETVIKTQQYLIVPDALNDPEWVNNPDVKLNMISYMGFPISYPDGTPFGTICVLDNKANRFSEIFMELVSQFQQVVEGDLELAFMNQRLGEENKQLSDYINEIVTLRGLLPICSKCKKIRNDQGYWIQIEEYIAEHSSASFTHGLCGKCEEELYGEQEWYKRRRNLRRDD